MINQFTTSLAEQMGIPLSRVSLVDGMLLGCRDFHLLQLYSGGRVECALISKAELDALNEGIQMDKLEERIRKTLKKMQKQLETS